MTGDTHVVALPVSGAGVSPYAVGAVAEVLTHAPGYMLRVCGPDTPITAAGGVVLRPAYRLDEIAAADTVIVTAVPDPPTDRCPEWADPLRAAATAGARIVGTGTGVFALAEAGLLDGHRAAVHWPYAPLMRALYPHVLIEPDAIVAASATTVTAAGGSCVVDACLYLISTDHGPATATRVARELLVGGIRAHGQRAYTTPQPIDPAADPDITGLLTYLTEHLDRSWTVAAIAAHAGLSRSSLHRRVHHATGRAPMEWLTEQRVHAARLLLAETDTPLTTIATSTGFDSTESLRHHLRRVTGLSPAEYRRTFTP